MAVVIKSNKPYMGVLKGEWYEEYENRVLLDGGTIVNPSLVTTAMNILFSNGISVNNIFSATAPSWGVKRDEQGRILKLYSLNGTDGDLVVGEDISNHGRPQFITSNNLAGAKSVDRGLNCLLESTRGVDYYKNNTVTAISYDGTSLSTDQPNMASLEFAATGIKTYPWVMWYNITDNIIYQGANSKADHKIARSNLKEALCLYNTLDKVACIKNGEVVHTTSTVAKPEPLTEDGEVRIRVFGTYERKEIMDLTMYAAIFAHDLNESQAKELSKLISTYS